jgi:hypothetical protein
MLMACKCISVVDVFTAIVVISISGRIEFTSGPWCDGSLIGSGIRAFIGHVLMSLGSAARLIKVTLAFLIPNAASRGYNTLTRPVH